MRLFLVCHCPTSATRVAAFPEDEPPEADSLARAAKLGAGLGRVERLWHGPERRAVETASALGLGAAPEAEPALRDIAVGAWAGRSLGQVQRDAPEALLAWLSDPEAAAPGGESVAMVVARTAAWLAAVPEARRGVAVVPQAIFRAAVVSLLGAPPASFWRIDAPPLARVALSRRDGRWSVRF
ncbi:histidine phosphatase family protein [Amaricoccus solimangrovi]|uniref:Histidine phosphatase family protein n=1 Tax=Amaricoccus solimangrovi TaxID=2589815 RepID=A0A501WG27_9RHOB|nr:histidine phosphatase family protein [Amaricoccus solimangrovi]TPE48823.1 histidine phosphatase family protein [Amaricoccus solimangrovi]